ncbi:Ribosome maturation factor rimM [Senna tora]|uniref:Ribosome maturation factor rimM n=1 Tax=Senna tora TaxID=362788 RepID=A0A835CFM8_9FABA|nr:Ribosome maturation factor rimM [Senna tora]
MMMQRTSLLCTLNSFSPSPTTLPTSHRLALPFQCARSHAFGASFSIQFTFYPPSTAAAQLAFPALRSTATEEIVDTSNSGSGFVDIGYIASVHGVQGEIRVKPSTDFPELRFSQPGKRWLKQMVSGEEMIQEVELEEGREHPGQKSWILKLRGINTVEQAKMLIGSTLLVTKEDRPELEEGEFYTHDLVGMKVFLKESGEPVGTVINVFNSGANDLLQVLLDPSLDILDKSGKPRSAETEASSQLVWVPFVEAIVPDVDMKRREMHITPPKGLLELNLRFDDRSKKERRQLEWKERKKFQKRLIAAKKKLCEMEQQHVFHGFRYGEKQQRNFLADQIVSVNSVLLQEALQNRKESAKRWKVTELVSALEAKHVRSKQILKESIFNESKDNLVGNITLQEKGLHLLSKGKMALVMLLNEKEDWGCIHDPDIVENEATETSSVPLLQKLLCDENFIKVENHASVPLILVCSAQEIVSLRKLFTENNYFAFDSEKVWFLEEEKLPVVSSLPEGQSKFKILMKSPWEILQSPVGSGGVISLFSTHSLADNLSNMGVEYIEMIHFLFTFFQICCPSERNVGGNMLLLGFVNSHKANIGIQISPTTADSEENTDMIFSMDFMKELIKQINKFPFNAIPKANSFVEKVDNDWVTVTSSTPNSYELSCSIYSSLDKCSLEKIWKTSLEYSAVNGELVEISPARQLNMKFKKEKGVTLEFDSDFGRAFSLVEYWKALSKRVIQ